MRKVEYISDEMVELNKRFDKRLKIGQTIEVPHTENHPYELLPENARFIHMANIGNEYTGFISVLKVIEDK